jgi:hypothetical protein
MMDAVEFLKAAERRYKSIPHYYANYIRLCGSDFDAYVAELEQWAAEHPTKTRQSEFLKVFPNATIRNGCIDILPCVVDQRIHDLCINGCSACDACRKNFWQQEVE